MRELLMNAAEGEMMSVVYDKTAMNGVNEYEEEMTVKVTDANPRSPGLMDNEAVVAVVAVNDSGESKNTGYIGMNALGGCEMKPDNSYFPSESVKSLSGGEA